MFEYNVRFGSLFSKRLEGQTFRSRTKELCPTIYGTEKFPRPSIVISSGVFQPLLRRAINFNSNLKPSEKDDDAVYYGGR